MTALSHDQDTNHGEKRNTEICNFCKTALMFLTGHGIKARNHPMWKLHISQCCASSGPGKHSVCGLMLHKPWWCTLLGNVQFPYGHGFLLMEYMTVMIISNISARFVSCQDPKNEWNTTRIHHRCVYLLLCYNMCNITEKSAWKEVFK